MESIGIAYTIILLIALYFRNKGDKESQESALVISNRLFVIIWIFFIAYHLFYCWYSGLLSFVFDFYLRSTGVFFYVFILYRISLLFLFFRRIAKNIVVSILIAIFSLYSDTVALFPKLDVLSVRMMEWITWSRDYLPSSWSFYGISFSKLLLDSAAFFLIWLVIFYLFKRGRDRNKEMELEEHLIG